MMALPLNVMAPASANSTPVAWGDKRGVATCVEVFTV
jgi:hypothetical protein